MKSDQQVINDYREGNFDIRLNLFLECRHLRNEFVRIDYEEFKTREKKRLSIEPVSGYSYDRRISFSPFTKILKWCKGWV